MAYRKELNGTTTTFFDAYGNELLHATWHEDRHAYGAKPAEGTPSIFVPLELYSLRGCEMYAALLDQTASDMGH